MTPADLIKGRLCTPRCLLANPVKKCRCTCKGAHHGALLDVDITALIERRGQFRGMSDAEILAGVA